MANDANGNALWAINPPVPNAPGGIPGDAANYNPGGAQSPPLFQGPLNIGATNHDPVAASMSPAQHVAFMQNWVAQHFPEAGAAFGSNSQFHDRHLMQLATVPEGFPHWLQGPIGPHVAPVPHAPPNEHWWASPNEHLHRPPAVEHWWTPMHPAPPPGVLGSLNDFLNERDMQLRIEHYDLAHPADPPVPEIQFGPNPTGTTPGFDEYDWEPRMRIIQQEPI
jgi:hypothetical protein